MTKIYTWKDSIRFRDCDSLGHVNNAVYHSYLENCRTHWLDDCLGLKIFESGDRIPIILAHTSIDYLGQLRLATELRITCALTKVGRKSFQHHYLIFGDDNICAKASAVLVWYNFDEQQSIQIPEEERKIMLTLLNKDENAGNHE